MSRYDVVREYPYPIAEVWHVLTDPARVAQWTTTGRGGRPEGFAPVVGTEFRFVGKPAMGWAGIVYCEIQEADAPRRLRYTWKGDAGAGEVTEVTYLLEEIPGGTRFTWQHTGFTGVGGFAMSKLLGSVRRRMLTEGLPPVLAAHHAAQPS
ncbi:SRPBCC domain-containing protein [Streptomyces sp. NPDC005435]|uniref:SRPBCC family protein n=1 Tax=Streptomyces sp. NPDC005435 TaxID=3154464 RepID=UPI003453A1AA